ncbi:MAG: TolC family protein, partial [candidate division Zixibacteria bacterium]|nr:TolC family protein [candidate division Zixibacteria bacterium]
MKNHFSIGSATFIFGLVIGQSLCAETVLTVERVRDLAVQNNRGYLTAQQEVRKAESQIVTSRADVFPDISIHGSYDRNLKIPSFFVQADTTSIEFRTGYNNSFGLSASVRQSLWEGGKVFSAMSISRLYKQYALDGQAAARAQVVSAAEVLFYQAILA